MYKNTIIIVFIVALLAAGGYMFFLKEKEDDEQDQAIVEIPVISPRDKFPELTAYRPEPKTSWGDFAQAIRSHIISPYEVDPHLIYEPNVDSIRGFLKGWNVEMSGQSVTKLRDDINLYLVNDNRTHYKVKLGEFDS